MRVRSKKKDTTLDSVVIVDRLGEGGPGSKLERKSQFMCPPVFLEDSGERTEVGWLISLHDHNSKDILHCLSEWCGAMWWVVFAQELSIGFN